MTEPTLMNHTGPARQRLAELAGRMYARKHVAGVVTAFVRSVGRRDQVVDHRANLVAGAVAAAQAWWLRTRLTPDNVHRPEVGWADALAGSLPTAVAGAAVTRETWSEGLAWTGPQAMWSAAGIGLLGDRRSRAARLALIFAAHVATRRNRETLRDVLPGIAVGLTGFAVIGVFLAEQLQRTAQQIDDLIDQVGRQQEEAARQRTASEIERDVILDTAERLRELQSLLATDPDAARTLAAAESRRLRGWLSDEEMVRPLSTSESAAAELEVRADAEERLRRTIRKFETAYRAVVAAVMVAEVVRSVRTLDGDRGEVAVAGLGLAHLASSVWWLWHPSRRADAALRAGDLAMNLSLSAAEARSSHAAGRPVWSLGYAVGITSAAGTVGAGRGEPPVVPLLMGLTRAGFGLGRSEGTTWTRVARSADEFMLVFDAAVTARRTADLALAQAQDISAQAAALTSARAETAGEQVRREQQYFVHDSALQVFLWATKSDLTAAQLRDWIDRELPKLDRAAEGADDDPLVEVRQGLDDLFAGFAALGIDAEVDVDDQLDRAGLDPSAAVCLLEVVNEALTNVFKHSEDRRPTVVVTADDRLVCTITNAVGPDAATSREGGVGMRAMRERAAAVGGTVDVRCVDGRFAVRLDLPRTSPLAIAA